MLKSATIAASELLLACWQEGRLIDCLPVHLQPETKLDGYAIQAELPERARSSLFGWKIAATSKAGQQHINVSGPLAGRILAKNVRAEGSSISLHGNHMRVAEVEFAFKMKTSLLPQAAIYSVEEVKAAIGTMHPAIEVPDSRFEDFTRVGAAQLIADDACAHLFVLGQAAPASWQDHDLSRQSVTARIVGKSDFYGSGANVLGDPLVALTWLANELSEIGVGLRGGEVVTTGTCIAPISVGPCDEIRADFGPLGTIDVSFSE